MEIIFWHNILSPHQASFIRALANSSHDVSVVASEATTQARTDMGWAVPDFGQARVILCPSAEQVCKIVDQSGTESVHVIAGARGTPLGKHATKRCIALRRRIGIISEAADPRGVKAWARWAKYSGEFFFQGNHFDFILGMGETGVKWFKRCGYPEAKLFPFCYVVDPVNDKMPLISKPVSGVCILYVGQFVQRKGIVLLLEGFHRVKNTCAVLVLMGDGVERASLLQRIEMGNMSQRVKIISSVANSEARELIAACDLFVLPSLYDGWGAVVNEALMAGTPVICSDKCGASDLIQYPWMGSVFQAGDVLDLTVMMDKWIANGVLMPDQRKRIRDWSECISGQRIAEYFLKVIEHIYGNAQRPTAPWRKAADFLN